MINVVFVKLVKLQRILIQHNALKIKLGIILFRINLKIVHHSVEVAKMLIFVINWYINEEEYYYLVLTHIKKLTNWPNVPEIANNVPKEIHNIALYAKMVIFSMKLKEYVIFVVILIVNLVVSQILTNVFLAI